VEPSQDGLPCRNFLEAVDAGETEPCYPGEQQCPVCEDKNPKCELWAGYNLCDHSQYAMYMSMNCKDSCGHCEDDCHDVVEYCPVWAFQGNCANEEVLQYMRVMCPRSCSLCHEDLVDQTSTTRRGRRAEWKFESEPSGLEFKAPPKPTRLEMNEFIASLVAPEEKSED